MARSARSGHSQRLVYSFTPPVRAYNSILQPSQQRFQLVCASFVRLEHVAPCLESFSFFYTVLMLV